MRGHLTASSGVKLAWRLTFETLGCFWFIPFRGSLQPCSDAGSSSRYCDGGCIRRGPLFPVPAATEGPDYLRLLFVLRICRHKSRLRVRHPVLVFFLPCVPAISLPDGTRRAVQSVLTYPVFLVFFVPGRSTLWRHVYPRGRRNLGNALLHLSTQ